MHISYWFYQENKENNSHPSKQKRNTIIFLEIILTYEHTTKLSVGLNIVETYTTLISEFRFY